MKPNSAINFLLIVVLAVNVVLAILSPPVSAVISTTTITGWLAPDSTHLSNSLLVIIMPLAGLGVFVWIGKTFKMKGDVGVFLSLSGFAIGSFIADLPASGTNTLAVPFADAIVSAILLFLWWWNS